MIEIDIQSNVKSFRPFQAQAYIWRCRGNVHFQCNEYRLYFEYHHFVTNSGHQSERRISPLCQQKKNAK